MTSVVNETTCALAANSLVSSYHKPSISLIVGNSVVSDIFPVNSFKNLTLSCPYSAPVRDPEN